MEPYANEPIMYFFDRLIYLLSTFFCSALLFYKMNGIVVTKRHRIIMLIIMISISSIFQLFGGNSVLFVKLLFMLSIVLTLVLFGKLDISRAIPTAILSVSIAYCFEYISIIISGTLFYIFGIKEISIYLSIVECVIQIILCCLLTQIKRLKKGFFYISDENRFGIGLLVSCYILLFSLLLTEYKRIHINVAAVLVFIIPLILTIIILWVRSIVKRYYKNKLQDRANEYTKQEIEDKDKRIERLESEVATLAKQLHRDNHLLSSLDRSVQMLAECDSEEQRAQIIEEIHTMCRERNELIAKEQQQNKILPSTGIALIDGSLSEMYVKAAARGISFDLTVSEEPYYLVNNIISQTELQTLLCDHIKDAIIAVESAGVTNGKILVTIEKNDGIFEIAVRDNGVDFDAETLAKLGREQITTHADDGGSGIGFMTTFETLRKTKGSLIITEYEQKMPFSKSVAFVFDGLNRFIISSYRKEELENMIQRDDVMIVDR